MTRMTEASTALRSPDWRGVWRRLRDRGKPFAPFALGVAATLLGLFLYNALNPPAPPLTLQEVDAAVAEAMAEATPAPAFSAQVYSVIQPSLVLITTGAARADDSTAPDAADPDTDAPDMGVPGEDGAADPDSEADPEARGLGSGVLISEQGDILTALHVVEGAERIQVIFADGTEATAEIVSSQPENDIAVLRPNRLPQLLLPAVMGNPNAMRVGDEAYAVGNPFGLYGSMSAGVVSGFERAFQAQGSDRRIEGLIQIDTAVNPGNSGGPLLNRYGQVVGIVVGVLNPIDEKFFVGIGFAVPITVAAGGAGAPPY